MDPSPAGREFRREGSGAISVVGRVERVGRVVRVVAPRDAAERRGVRAFEDVGAFGDGGHRGTSVDAGASEDVWRRKTRLAQEACREQPSQDGGQGRPEMRRILGPEGA